MLAWDVLVILDTLRFPINVIAFACSLSIMARKLNVVQFCLLVKRLIIDWRLLKFITASIIPNTNLSSAPLAR